MVDLEIGLMLPTMSEKDRSPGDIVAAARYAEDLGFESVWVVDQLIAGTGAPLLDSITALAAAAAVTERIRLGVGVLVLPLRPVAWVAKQVATLQHLSGDRVILGVGVGGDRHNRSWAAVGVPSRERGRRTDDALRVLPDLIAGKPVQLGYASDTPTQLGPAAAVPPIIAGGMSDAAVRRAAAHDGWFLLASPAEIPAQLTRLGEQAAAAGRATPPATTSAVVALDGDRSLPDHATIVRSLCDPDGMFAMSAEYAEESLVHGDPGFVAGYLNGMAARGVRRVVVTLVGGDWFRQADLLARTLKG
ncbi:LLM class flavin-dependent oxidoreductase [Nocardia carnea]|uniref:LLM class flavin-dependent oxidoreductase n=1 Tax=Nocardia carnea TaxID=37328 RepID=UPI002458DBB1|nr:LLM class flavin-dependent oxidoreductase [Nocardia carnea]